MENYPSHYNSEYFKWQNDIGKFGGWANQTKYTEFLKPNSTIIDFGCGGGHLLSAIDAKRKIGVEVNPLAAEEAKKYGLEVYNNPTDIPDEIADFIISNNALEHTQRPLDELKSLLPKLKHNGLCIFVVPCENITMEWKPNDINNHLYSWSPMCLGNLFIEAGYDLVESKPYIHKWPPNYLEIAKKGRLFFENACRIYGQEETTWFQVRTIAKRS
tara:strand:- start:3607 stop:4251 length:645 start_codon:yes stop_codon:yes gene_type:complete